MPRLLRRLLYISLCFPHAIADTWASGAVCCQQGRACMRANVEAMWVTSSASESDGAPLESIGPAEPSCVRSDLLLTFYRDPICSLGCTSYGNSLTSPEPIRMR